MDAQSCREVASASWPAAPIHLGEAEAESSQAQGIGTKVAPIAALRHLIGQSVTASEPLDLMQLYEYGCAQGGLGTCW
mgnify:CR=1 FL=1